MTRALRALLGICVVCTACEGERHAPVTVHEPPVTSRATQSAPEENADGGLRIVEPAPDDDVASLVRARRLSSRAEGRVLVVYAGAAWCEPCRKLRARAAATDGLARVDLLAFDADRDRDRLAAAGYVFTHIPYVALPGPDGAPADAAAAPHGDMGYVLTRLSVWASR
jgi:hypothetical protein